MNNNVTFVDCDCLTHHIRVEYDDEIGEFYFSLLEGMADVLPFWWRIKCAWRTLTTGKDYNDSIILNKASIKDLVKFLKERID